jgi:hypothetical protein
MQIAHLKVVQSSTRPGLSLRGPKGRGQQDSVHEHITRGGFEPDQDVVLITKTDFYRMLSIPGYADLMKLELESGQAVRI